MSSPAHHSLAPACRRAALAIAGTAALVLIALFHHPVVGKVSSAQESLVKLVELELMDAVMHGSLMLVLAILAAGLATLSMLLGWRRAPVIVATTAYGLACCSVAAAMLLDGFVVPQLAVKFVAAPEGDIQVVYIILRAIGTILHVLTKAGLLAMCIAMLAWSLALARTPALPGARWGAAVGMASGLGSGLYLLFGNVLLTPAALMAIFAVHSLWYLSVAVLMFRVSSVLSAGEDRQLGFESTLVGRP